MKYLLMIFIIIQVTSCGKLKDMFTKEGPSPYRGRGVDARLMPYIDYFYDLKGFYPNYPIVIDNTDKLGVCISYSSGEKAIVVSADYMPIDDEYSLFIEYIILHEIGHCTYGRPHLDDFIQTEDGARFKSMMNKYIMNINTYEDNKDYYLDELFNPNDVVIEEYFTLTEEE